MPEQSPFHPRTSKLCTSYHWKDWAGYYAVCSYDTYMEREYFAFRHSAGMIDVTPLFKYEITGPDAGEFLSYVTVRNIKKLKTGRVQYCCWCDDAGKMVDDGTISRLRKDHFRMTSALPMFSWLSRLSHGFDVNIKDSSQHLAALSLQGPKSRDILKSISDADMDGLKFFTLTHAKLDDIDVTISRTGYTGDLGYEIWVENQHALAVWDALMDGGKPYGMEPAGLDAMDITRIEAGFVLNGIDYFSAPHCLIEARKSSPFEAGLGWTVKSNRDYFMGQSALQTEEQKGSVWSMVGLVFDWDEYEALFRKHGLPPEVPAGAWRTAIPVYNQDMKQIGQATSGAWSPMLKKNLALASIHSQYDKPGTQLRIEATAEYHRSTVTATVTETPFFNPQRKKA
ncbi:MAG: aminomethyl transferase family protein [bacterium]|nr:aminomethyl transferase family protein [bacterium]